jgi:excinuclease ABC subunit C
VTSTHIDLTPQPTEELRLAELDLCLSRVPKAPGFLTIRGETGEPLLTKADNLHSRLQRLLGPRSKDQSKRLHLRFLVRQAEYSVTGNRLDQWLGYFLACRAAFPKTYWEKIRVRPAKFLRLLLSNPFPRTQIASGLGGPKTYSFGPFKTRLSAEELEQRFLDRFTLRRCTENLFPALDHPGCLYGEIGKCLRPCQRPAEEPVYSAEVSRALEFLRSAGESEVAPLEIHRDAASQNLDFEVAARLHQQIEHWQQILAGTDELVGSADRLTGFAVVRDHDAAQIWPVKEGKIHQAVLFPNDFRSKVTLESRLRDLSWSTDVLPGSSDQHLALLARWKYSSLCDGYWISAEKQVSWRKLANATRRLWAPVVETQPPT